MDQRHLRTPRAKPGTRGAAALPARSRPWSPHPRLALAGVVLLAAALRVAYVLDLRQTPWFSHLVVDPEYYDAWAQQIAAGDWLGSRPFYMDPLYPYVLAVLYRLWGHDLLAARLLNVACSAGACVLIAGIGRLAGGRAAAGLLAALGYALYGPDVFYVGEVDKTSLSIFLAALTLRLTLATSLGATCAAGVSLGLTALTRANFLVFAPLGALLLAFRPSGGARGVARAALFVCGFAAVLLPVCWRNHHVSGEWILTTTQAGQNFYTGNNPSNPYGAYGAVEFVRPNPHFEELDFRAAAEQRVGRPLGANEVSSFWFREGLVHLWTEPAFAARAFGRKLLLFWNDFEISDSQDQYLLERFSPVLRLPLLGFGAVLPFACLGAVAAYRRRREVRLLVWFVVVYWLSLALFFLFSRYRIQVIPALLPLGAVGLLELVARGRERRPGPLARAAALLLAVGWVGFQTVGHFWREQPRVIEMRLRQLASMSLAVGRPDEAIGALQEAIAPCTHGCPLALADLYETYRATGRWAEGEAFFRQFVAQHPQQRDAAGYLEALVAGRSTGAPSD